MRLRDLFVSQPGDIVSDPRRSAEVPAEPAEPATPIVPEIPPTPIVPDPGTPGDPARPPSVPEPDEPAEPIVPEPSGPVIPEPDPPTPEPEPEPDTSRVGVFSPRACRTFGRPGHQGLAGLVSPGRHANPSETRSRTSQLTSCPPAWSAAAT